MMATKMAMSRALTLVVALIIALATQAQAAKWRYCDGDWEARIEDATVVPDPARAGKEINVIINGEIGEPPLRWLRRLVAGPDFSSQLNLRFLPPPRPACCKTAGRLVEGGDLDLTVLFHSIPVYKETDNLCDRLDSCPAKGDFVVDAKQKLPSFTLPVRHQLFVSATPSLV